MTNSIPTDQVAEFLGALDVQEEPMGMFYTGIEPTAGVSPKEFRLPTADDETQGNVDWSGMRKHWSCVLGNLWIARKRRSAAYFAEDRIGCLGGAFFLGFNKPQLDAICHYVSTGIPGVLDGERYFPSPEVARQYYEDLNPDPAPGQYCVFKPLSMFKSNELPVFVTFFDRPEIVSGLHQLTTFATDDPEAVMSPWSAGCGNIVAWPRKYLAEGKLKACLGGWDLSCRKYLKTDEITFTVPFEMFRRMVERWKDSFLTTKTWEATKKRAAKSRHAWGDG